MAGPRPRHLSPLVTRERNPRIDTEVGRSVVALSWPPFVSISQAKRGGGGGVGKWKKKARHPSGWSRGVGIANRGMKGDGAVVVDTAPWVGFVAGIPGRETCSNFPRRRNDSRKRRN